MAAATIAEVSHAVLPAVFDSPAVQIVRLQRFDCNMVLLEVDAATPTVAEITMASAETRKTCFKETLPAYAIPYPPTNGMDPQFEGGVHDIERYLEEKLGTAFIRPEDVPFLKDEEHRRKMIAGKLRRESRERRTRYVAFKFERPEDRQTARRSLGALRYRYPELVLLDLSTDPDLLIEQRDLFEPFELILNPPEGNR